MARGARVKTVAGVCRWQGHTRRHKRALARQRTKAPYRNTARHKVAARGSERVAQRPHGKGRRKRRALNAARHVVPAHRRGIAWS
eukprot:15455817-Alexandrium_andersonii.AAC.1